MTQILTAKESEDLMLEFVRSKCRALAEARGWKLEQIIINPVDHSIDLVGEHITPEDAVAFYNELIETCKGVLTG